VKRLLVIVSLGLGLAALAAWAGPAGGAYVLRRSVIARGGGRATGGVYVLYNTIGQPAPGRATNGGYTLTSGFQLPRSASDPPPPPQGCGDGQQDPDAGEDCDRGQENGAPGSCCSSTCTFEDGSEVCRPAAGPCDLDERCTGQSDRCPAADLKSAALCRSGPDVCFKDAFCDGRSDECPANPPAEGVLCIDPDPCTPVDSCHEGVCTPGPRVCDVQVPNEYAVRFGRKKRVPRLVVECFSDTRGTCDAQVFLPTDALTVRTRSVDAAEAPASPVAVTGKRTRPIPAGKTVRLKLRLTPAGKALLKRLHEDTATTGTVKVTVDNARGRILVTKLLRVLRLRN
jgi:hypothetical protein